MQLRGIGSKEEGQDKRVEGTESVSAVFKA